MAVPTANVPTSQPSKAGSRVLVVEDDPDIVRLLTMHLRDLPCQVDVAHDGCRALEMAFGGRYDAIVLDLTLPRLDGLTVCRTVREQQVFTPILILTARGTENDRVVGLEGGADDYMSKPFSIPELQARVRALLRRGTDYAAPVAHRSVLAFGDLAIAIDRRQVTLDGAIVDLTAKEFDLLLWFARHPGRVFTREQLLDAVWGYSHAGYGHTVNSHINRLRAKIEQDPGDPTFVLTVWSVGYKFREQVRRLDPARLPTGTFIAVTHNLETAMEHTYTDSNREGLAARMPATNVGNVERVVTVAAGAALLGYAWRQRSRGLGLASAGLIARGATGFCPAYAAVGVDHSDTTHALSGERGVHVRESISLSASPEELYTFWRQLERLPEVMPHLERVEQLDYKVSRWTAKAFGQVPVTWLAEIINEVPFETIGWRTLAGESIQHAGSVVFKGLPGTGGTEVRVHLQYAPPGGKAGAWFAAMLGQDPARLTREGLQALKNRFARREP